jgi:hypothetical protein
MRLVTLLLTTTCELLASNTVTLQDRFRGASFGQEGQDAWPLVCFGNRLHLIHFILRQLTCELTIQHEVKSLCFELVSEGIQTGRLYLNFIHAVSLRANASEEEFDMAEASDW